MGDLVIKNVESREEINQVLHIRKIVFIEGQSVPEERERDKYDKTAKHFLVLYNNKPIGCARVRFYRDFLIKTAKIERMAIKDNYQNKGIGKKLLKYLIEFCKKAGAEKAILNAQCHAERFYKSCGFKPHGKVFMDANIEHIEMRINL